MFIQIYLYIAHVYIFICIVIYFTYEYWFQGGNSEESSILKG